MAEWYPSSYQKDPRTGPQPQGPNTQNWPQNFPQISPNNSKGLPSNAPYGYAPNQLPQQHYVNANPMGAFGTPYQPTGHQGGNSFEIFSAPSSIDSGHDTSISWRQAFSTTLEGEIPLLQELGINFQHIKSKSLSVLNPFKEIDKHIMDDTDLAGPLIFCLLLAFLGKFEFDYIYGIASIGFCFVYFILNVMSESGIDLYKTISVLGYCLLPMVFLSFLSFLKYFSSLWFYGILAILWSTFSSSKMFVNVLSLKEQGFLIAYPITLLYVCFALISIYD